MEKYGAYLLNNQLPGRCPWDHAIDLTPGAKLVDCKIYPLNPSEQKALDDFLEENLRIGRIRPLSSLMAVFMMASVNSIKVKAMSGNALLKRNVEVNMREFVRRSRHHPAKNRSLMGGPPDNCDERACPNGLGDCSVPCNRCTNQVVNTKATYLSSDIIFYTCDFINNWLLVVIRLI